VTTYAVAEDEEGVVSATLGSKTLGQPLTVRRMGLYSLSLAPTSVAGGNLVAGKATLSCKAGPGPVTVELASSNAAVANPIAASIVVPQGLQSASFDVTISPVPGKTTATITATANGSAKSRALTITSAASVSPTSLKFGTQYVGSTSEVMLAMLTNKGVLPFTVTSIGLTGTGAASFGQTNDCPPTLDVGASCTIGVTFTPMSATSKTAKLSIATSAAATPLSVSLSGTGLAPP
jgi:hypothetical protein